MEIPERFYKKLEFIETSSGNKVSKNSVICIILQGRTIVIKDCIVRGDLLLKLVDIVLLGDIVYNLKNLLAVWYFSQYISVIM
jgi:hypothetical protein